MVFNFDLIYNQVTPAPTVCPTVNPSTPPSGQTHLHEFLGSTKLAEMDLDRHNHRFAGVTSQAIQIEDGSHVHEIFTSTDFFEDHHHEVGIRTGPPIDVGNGKHVHFASGFTTIDEGHFHEFQFATLILEPLTPVIC